MKKLSILLAACVLTLAATAALGQPVRGGFAPFVQNEHGLLKHSGKYPAFDIAWDALSVEGAKAIYPHPVLPKRVVLATTAGLSLTDDGGKTWAALSAAAPAGKVTGVEFCPDTPDTFYLSTEAKGIWVTKDLGKTFAQVGSKAAGMGADACTQVVLFGADPRFQTLLAAHGEACKGYSRSDDGGKTWVVMAKDYFVHRICAGGPGAAWMYLLASPADEPDVRTIFYCPAITEKFSEMMRDVACTDFAVGLNGDESVYWSSSSAKLLRLAPRLKAAGIGPDLQKCGSVGVTWGSSADSELLYALDPGKLGLVTSEEAFLKAEKPKPTTTPAGDADEVGPHTSKTFASHKEGLGVGGYVKEGSQVRANATGTDFYAVVNNTLYLGRRATGKFEVADLAVTPALISFSRNAYAGAMAAVSTGMSGFERENSAAAAAKPLIENMRKLKAAAGNVTMTITARVTSSAGDKPAIVTVDLSRLIANPRVRMFDDGAHNDGAAGDGVYGITIGLGPDVLVNRYLDWRRQMPGPIGLTVTAIAADGSLSSAVAVVGVFPKPEGFPLRQFVENWEPKDFTGDLVVDKTPAEKFLGASFLSFAVKGKPWSLPLALPPDRNITGYQALAFWIKSDANTGQELFLQLKDHSNDAVATSGTKVPLVKEGLVEGGAIDGTWRLVTIPLARLVKDVPQLRTTSIGWVILSGEGAAAQKLQVSEMLMLATPEEVVGFKKAGDDAKAAPAAGVKK